MSIKKPKPNFLIFYLNLLEVEFLILILHIFCLVFVSKNYLDNVVAYFLISICTFLSPILFIKLISALIKFPIFLYAKISFR